MKPVSDQEIFLGYCENNSTILLQEFIETRRLDLHEGLRVAVKNNSHEAANIIKKYVVSQKTEYDLDIDIEFIKYCYEGDIRAVVLAENHNVNVRIGLLIANHKNHKVLSLVLKRFLTTDYLYNTRPIIRAAIKAFNKELLQLIIAGGIPVTVDMGKTVEEKKFIIKLLY